MEPAAGYCRAAEIQECRGVLPSSQSGLPKPLGGIGRRLVFYSEIVFCYLILAILAACGWVPTQTPEPFPNPVLEVAGEEEVVFDWSKDRCESLDIPDIPARAFRDDQGNVQLIATHYVNRRFVGPDLNTLKRDCQVIMQSASLEDPSLFSYHQWLASPYTDDGKTIYALVHNEYYGSEAYVPCMPAYAGDPSCWYNDAQIDSPHFFELEHIGLVPRLIEEQIEKLSESAKKSAPSLPD